MRSFKTLIYLLLFSNVNVYAQSEINSNELVIDYPKPVKTEKLLFYIQRSMNKNTIAYELNLDNQNKIINDDPIHPYWIRYEDDGESKELTYIERKFAYGINSKAIQADKNNYEISLVSYPIKMELLKSDEQEGCKVFIKVNDKRLELKRIFFKTDGGSFWNPKLEYIDITGINVKTKIETCERIIP